MLRDRVPGQSFVAQADQPDCPGGHSVLPRSSAAAARRISVNLNVGPAAYFLVLPLRAGCTFAGLITGIEEKA